MICMLALLDVRLSSAQPAITWHPLFDGKSSQGWLEVTGRPFPAESWVVEDGCLKAIPNPAGIQDIRTVETFDSFELQFEWKILKAGNSGVKYLVQKTDRWTNAKGLQARARGLEYQLVDDANGEGSDPTRLTGALYSVLAPKAQTSKPPGEWNHSRLVVRSDWVEHWLNDTLVLEYRLDQPEVMALLRLHRKGDDVVRTSPICLQNHGTPAWFRGLRIRRLD